MNKLTFKVRQEHIDEGSRRDCNKCALALALEPYFTVPISVGHLMVTTSFVPNSYSVISYLTNEACDFVLDFDRGKPVKPTEFTFYLTPTGVKYLKEEHATRN